MNEKFIKMALIENVTDASLIILYFMVWRSTSIAYSLANFIKITGPKDKHRWSDPDPRWIFHKDNLHSVGRFIYQIGTI